jgi:hypothetical protein
MALRVSSAVSRKGRPHGVITALDAPDATVAWHLKEASLSMRAGTATATAIELVEDLVPDSTCPYCKEFLAPVK